MTDSIEPKDDDDCVVTIQFLFSKKHCQKVYGTHDLLKLAEEVKQYWENIAGVARVCSEQLRSKPELFLIQSIQDNSQTFNSIDGKLQELKGGGDDD